MTDDLSEIQNVHCPVCGKTADAHYSPFCSKRCADVDLNRWLSGVYVVHTDERPEPTESIPVLNDEKN